jgi:GDP-L-fucose synthase
VAILEMIWKNKKVLVTGSEGMIGKELVIQLLNLGAEVIKFDINDPKEKLDVTWKPACENMCENIDYVFHLFGIKGNPKMTNEKPVDFMAPMLFGDTNMIVSAQKQGVKKFLYTSSIAVENPETDKYPAWAKQTAENLIQAMRIQYPKGTEYCIVRPANVYGRFDNPNKENCMVITDLIRKAKNEPYLEIWGDGSNERDLINAKDVARGMIKAMEEMPEKPVNLCSGEGYQIGTIAKYIAEKFGKEVKFDKTKPTGHARKVMQLNWDFKPEIGLHEGLNEVIQWAKESW